MTVSRAVVELQRQLSRVTTEKATVEQQRRAAMDAQRLEAAQARARARTRTRTCTTLLCPLSRANPLRAHAHAQPYFPLSGANPT